MGMNPDVQTMLGSAIADRLRVLGFDGLLQADCECACELDDLMPCGLSPAEVADCEAAYKRVTDPNDCGCGEGCDWHMTLKKPEPESIALRER